MKRAIVLILACVFMFTLFAGCASPDTTAPPADDPPAQEAPPADDAPPPAEPDADLEELVANFLAAVAEADDVSDIPDWTGPQMTLRYWDGHGEGRPTRPAATEDVVWSEIARITGITIDLENSFDNSGQDLPSRTAVLAATNDWPHIGYNVQSTDLIDNGVIWDLTDYLPTYAPHVSYIMNALHPPVEGRPGGWLNTGRWYQFPVDYRPGTDRMTILHPDFDMTRFMYVSAPMPRHGWNTDIMVRDDILKLAYPEARTLTELEELYMAQGYFTREDIYDVPGTTKEDVFDFFYKIAEVIDEHNINEDGRPVFATHLNQGGDNWALAASLLTGINGLPNINYVTYWNLASQSLERVYAEDWFKEDLLRFNQMMRDRVASAESLIDDGDAFWNKLNNGEYAITYAWNIPDQGVLEAAGKDYRYRRVYFDIPQDLNSGLNMRGTINPIGGIAVFKDTVSEAELPQVLMMLDFLHSDAGMKLSMWGPRSAGLFEETPDGRRFTDPELEQMALFGAQNGSDVYYNLQGGDPVGSSQGGAWPHIPFGGLTIGGIYYPKYVYNMTEFPRDPGMVNVLFHSGLFDIARASTQPIEKMSDFWNFSDEVAGFASFNDARGGGGIEDDMKSALAAGSDAEFETRFQRMVENADAAGLTEEALREAEQLMRDNYTADWNAWVQGYN